VRSVGQEPLHAFFGSLSHRRSFVECIDHVVKSSGHDTEFSIGSVRSEPTCAVAFSDG
jgi:hypothetical protein